MNAEGNIRRRDLTIDWAPVTTSLVTTSTSQKRADLFALKSLTALFHYKKHLLTMRSRIHCYRPQRSCGKVIFLDVSVILSTGGRSARQTPSPRRPLQRTVRILLECILVFKYVHLSLYRNVLYSLIYTCTTSAFC